MESLTELKTICQTTAQRDVSNVYMRYVCRPVSIRITRLLIPTAVTADQVSAVMILTGVLAAAMFLTGIPFLFYLGIALFQLWYVLDCVDGEVARYRNFQQSKVVTVEKTQLPITGAYWDYLNHYIVHGLVPFAAAFGMGGGEGRGAGWVLAGFLATMGQILLLAIHDTKSRLFLGKITRLCQSPRAVTCPQKPPPESQARKVKKWSAAKWVFVAVHYTTTYPTVMNVLTLLAVIELVTGRPVARSLFVLYYAAASAGVFLVLAAKNLRNSGLDKEFDGTFAALEIPSGNSAAK
ncbi:MAG: hypothetical protein WCU74_06800 [Candidatus Omnitrophota bacterium]